MKKLKLEKLIKVGLKNKKIIIFGLCLLFVLFYSRRVHQLKTLGYQYLPEVGEILDEYDYAWLGKSILTTGIPTAWSDIDVYLDSKNKPQSGEIDGFFLRIKEEKPSLRNYLFYPKPLVKIEQIDYGKGETTIRFIQPYLDHPPLAGIIYALGINKESKTFADVDARQFRSPAIWLSHLTGVLIFLLGTLLYHPLVGIIAFLFYSTVPSFVFASRLALAENVLTPFFLMTINLLLLGKKTKRKTFFFFAGVLAGLTALTKLSGWSALLAGGLLLSYWKRPRKEVLTFIIPASLLGGLYFAYGLFLSRDLFWQVLMAQSSRTFWGPLSWWQNLARVNLLHFPLDGWWLGGFIILIYLFREKENRELALIFAAYFLTLIFLGGGSYAWYFFPFIPLLVLAIALLIKRMALNLSPIDIALFFIFPFSSTLYWGFIVFHQGLNWQWLYRFLIVFFLAVTLLAFRIKKNFLLKSLWIIFLLFLIYRLYLWNYRSILFLIENWGKLRFPFIITY